MEELTTYKHSSSAIAKPLPIEGMGDMVLLGEFVYKSGMLGANTAAAGLMIAATCQQEGMSLIEFGRRYHVTSNGKVTMKADRMLAEFMAMGGTVEWIQWDAVAALGKWSFGANKNKEIGFTLEEAEKAEYVKPGTNWVKDPASQLRARCITRAVRMVCPGAVAGVYTPEEMEDVHGSEPEGANNAPQAMSEEQAAEHLKNASSGQTQAPQQQSAQPQNQQQEIPVTNQAASESAPTPFEEEPNYELCPMSGTVTGLAWSTMELKTLQMALNTQDSSMMPGHYNAIQNEINSRGNLL